MGQDVCNVPSININKHTLEVVKDFTYLGSTITSNLSDDVEINKRIGKASSAISRLDIRVCEKGALTLNTRVQEYKACVLSILLYSGDMDDIYQAGASPQHISSTLPQAHHWHQIAGSHPQHRSAQAGKHSQHECSPQRTSLAMAWPLV